MEASLLHVNMSRDLHINLSLESQKWLHAHKYVSLRPINSYTYFTCMLLYFYPKQTNKPKNVAALTMGINIWSQILSSYILSGRYNIFGPLIADGITVLVKKKILTFWDQLCTNYQIRKGKKERRCPYRYSWLIKKENFYQHPLNLLELLRNYAAIPKGRDERITCKSKVL